jgi:hypothetical protein
MNIERIQLLRDVMVRVDIGERADTKFNMMDWYTLDEDNECGKAACAAGHLCLDQRAQDLGLKLVSVGDWMEPQYQGAFDFYALTLFFEITTDEARRLFDPHDYIISKGGLYDYDDEDIAKITPREVIKRIDNMIDTHNRNRKGAANAVRRPRQPRRKKQ